MAAVVERSDFVLGQEVERFESDFAAYCDAAWAVGVDSGTSAVELALRALGIGHGDEVITVANTFIATVTSITHTGATPVLVDMDPLTYQIDVDQMASAVGPRTAAVIPVHLYGHPAEMDAVKAVAVRHNLAVVEDAAQAHGARYRGSRVGALGSVGAFSLYPGKNLGAYGDAGVVVTNDPDIAARIRLDRNHGSIHKYVHQAVGFNRRLDTIQAAVVGVKLRYLDEWNAARRRHAVEYEERLSGIPEVRIPQQAPHTEPVHHLYPIRVGDRDELAASLGTAGVSTGIHYPIPVHLQDAYSALGYAPGAFPETERHADEVLSLPMFPELTSGQIERVCAAIASHYGSASR